MIIRTFPITNLFSMTPIKVRGKRGQHQAIRKRYKSSHNPLRSAIISFAPPSDSSVQSMPAHSSTMNPPVPSDNHKAANLAPIERLPTEVLEIIFFNCLNLGLPQASPIIGNALSSFYCKARLAELAFSSIGRYDLLHAHHLRDTLIRIPTEWIASRASITKFQSDLLKSRWMTVDFWRRYVSIYLEKTILSVFQYHNLEWMDGTPAKLITRAMVAQYVQAAGKFDREGSGGGKEDVIEWNISLPRDIFPQVRIEIIHDTNGAETKKVIIAKIDGSVRPNWRIEWRESWMMVHCRGCRIPTKLLHGPWTEGKSRLLQILIFGGATIEQDTTTAGEVAERGLIDAIKERNPTVVAALLGFLPTMPYQYRECDMACWTYGLPCLNSLRSDSTWVMPEASHVALAVMHEGCDKDIVEMLLLKRDCRRADEDDALIEWAVQKKTEGDERGPWLLEQLEQYPARYLLAGEKWTYIPPSPEDSQTTTTTTTRAAGRFVVVHMRTCPTEPLTQSIIPRLSSPPIEKNTTKKVRPPWRY